MTDSGTPGGRTPAAKTKRAIVADELRSMIASGDLPRGTRIQQDELAARFETSITPVREALRELEAEGLLVGEAHRGVRVAETNVADQEGIYVARRLLEPFAAQLATLNVSRRDIAQARTLVDEMADAAERGDRADVRKANRDFHFLIYERCEIPSLVRVIEGLWGSFPWDTLDVLDPNATRAQKDHQAIVDRLAKGDVSGVALKVEDHIARSYRELVKHLTGAAPSDDPFETVRSELEPDGRR
ncbi:MAG TPA: GntR family transcriptional regulator [Gaiellaceae bacterium]|nr:GntR family transcriptional regulator [Gaiellaceae bacterium]